MYQSKVVAALSRTLEHALKTDIKPWIVTTLKKRGPLTDRDLHTLAGWDGIAYSPSGLRTRRHELVTDGKVQRVDNTRLLTGRWASLWDIIR